MRWFFEKGILLIPLYPLFAWDGFLFPFVSSKALFIYVVIEVIFAVWLVGLLRGLLPRKSFVSPISVAVTAFITLLSFTALWGMNTGKSFWSTYERMDGLLTFLHLAGLFVMLATSASQSTWKRLIGLSITVYAVTTIGALMVWLASGDIDVRASGVWGNPSYFASYTLLHLFVIFAAYVSARRGAIKNMLAFCLALGFIALVASGTRGALLGFAVGALVTLGGFVWYRGTESARHVSKRFFVVAMLIVVLIVSSGVLLGTLSADRAFPISLAQVAEESRVQVWNIALHGISERPVLGWGAGNFDHVFNTYYDPRLSLQEPWFDRAHSAIFDWFIAGGVSLVITYFAMFAAVAYFLITRDTPLPRHIRMALLGLIAAYLVHGLFLFDTFASLIPLIVVFAYLHWNSVSDADASRIVLSRTISTSIVAVALVVTLSVCVVVPAYALSAVRKSTLSSYSATERIAALEAGLRASLFDHEGLALAFVESVLSEQPTDTALLEAGYTTLAPLATDDRASVRVIVTAGYIAMQNRNSEAAVHFLERARERAPMRKDVHQLLAEAYFTQGNYEKMRDEAKHVFMLESLFPHTVKYQYYIDQSRIEYASALIYADALEEAKEILQEGFGIPLLFDERIIEALMLNEHYEEVISLLTDELIARPDPQTCISLAAAELKRGSVPRTLTTLNECRERFPQSSQQIIEISEQVRTGAVTADDI
ncbi:MAG: hypothetical protein Greene07147_775 [Parcubacteria group bacterium Greene0714_7]|nr:MAG: hypothetical protein Greene07147_775 [Parcubacteria group bacterium Greene0714_7]